MVEKRFGLKKVIVSPGEGSKKGEYEEVQEAINLLSSLEATKMSRKSSKCDIDACFFVGATSVSTEKYGNDICEDLKLNIQMD